MDAVGACESGDEGVHGGAHFGVVEVADVVVEILEGAAAHICKLCHGAVWIAQHDPFAVVDAFIEHVGVGFVLQSDALFWHVGVFRDVVTGAHGDVGVHAFHLFEQKPCVEVELFFSDAHKQRAGELRV